MTAPAPVPFDPIQRAQEVERLCTRETSRRYHRFRVAAYYGGIVTADAVGCCFLCAFCWNYHRNEHPEAHGAFWEPHQVAARLLELAEGSGIQRFRISGSEPILGETSLAHLVQVVTTVQASLPRALFILETNGLLLGFNPAYTQALPTRGLAVRVALKGVDEESFQRVTGAQGAFFSFTLHSLILLQERAIRAWPAVMADVHGPHEIRLLERKLRALGVRAPLERERLERYPAVMRRLRARGLA